MHTALNNLLFGRWWMDSKLGFKFLESKALQLLPLGMPIDLYMMRHGLSLQNIAASYLRAGKFKEFLALYREAAEFLKGCRGPQIPLVQEGRLQAQAAHRSVDVGHLRA